MSKKFFSTAMIGAVLLIAAAGPASAGTKDDIRALQAQVARLEQAAAAQSQATVRISQLESQIQQLTGRIEELTYALDQANTRLDAVSAALAGDQLAYGPDDEFGPRASQGGPVDLTGGDPIAREITRADAGSPSGADVNSASHVTGVELPLNPDAAYNYASGFLLRGEYAKAKSAFKLYVEAFPNHSRTPDAKFKLGEIHLALGENADAAEVFIDHIRSYPNDPHASEAYLKLGTAFSRLEKQKEACTVFKTMKNKFPNAEQAVSQRADIEMARIDCK